ncbi:SWIM zinc finger family protein [Halapricum hydrolyticum]|uniref:SWIM zinc finger family protein n=1 Tax=Halapricum hydrolyticum TaxID=2979991 RepID=A0AAE3LEW1_9EURY|nr:SWIM zinc finger family protein [Halapricum hydrolyticum]MCU4717436.1 SWIM zinc finger family protein [Halapricum hydrolyticum]MCU4726600.1 SWIM zinc finger family protein [Halapricum hydrolyticum]
MTDQLPGRSTRKTALAPDTRTMDERAARAWTERMAVRPLGGGRYAVDSHSGATYVVNLPESRCTCPDHRIRGERCKHIRRVAIEVTSHRVPPPGKRQVRCAQCGVETFVEEDSAEPWFCSNCRFEPGDVVLDRETGDRLVVAGVTTQRADEYVIDTVDSTVAAYETNAGYPDDDLVVEASYLGDVAHREQPRTYAFPHSRLAATEQRLLDI